VHKDAKGPVNLVQTENTLVYNYWNNKKLRHEISVMELYENSKQEILTAGQVRQISIAYPPSQACVCACVYVYLLPAADCLR